MNQTVSIDQIVASRLEPDHHLSPSILKVLLDLRYTRIERHNTITSSS